ncbi:winged helix-turn-helix domain-containing protein [Halovivax cerinus]|uniref:Winged helix-turn-helix domain-containing protein n=1 Tax=Halovivax cerinus TaxID=1487865 RepID=A0ABD5NJR3_9EURY|nr:winged helix-turn-helix domain-containing protein [Halovivax cerinus]
MGSNTLDALGRAILEAIESGRAVDGSLESDLDADGPAVADRLAQLVDNGLIREDAETGRGGGTTGYEVTENGLRLLDSRPVAPRANRVDTPATVDRTIADFDLRPDEDAAVRNAFWFLRFWGDATSAEIVDAAYSEEPAGYETADRWWDDCVRDRLAALPDVQVVVEESIEWYDRWTYDGTPVVERDDRDGRSIADPVDEPRFASARHAVETTPLDEDDRAYARAAFAALARRGRASTDELRAAVAHGRGKRSDATDTSADRLAVLESVPGIDLEEGSDGEPVWVYDPTVS